MLGIGVVPQPVKPSLPADPRKRPHAVRNTGERRGWLPGTGRRRAPHPLRLAPRQGVLSTKFLRKFPLVGKNFTIPGYFFLPVGNGLRGSASKPTKRLCRRGHLTPSWLSYTSEWVARGSERCAKFAFLCGSSELSTIFRCSYTRTRDEKPHSSTIFTCSMNQRVARRCIGATRAVAVDVELIDKVEYLG